jgi:hypothetical protein
MDIQDTAIEDIVTVRGMSKVDAKIFIQLYHYQQEREGDITGRPNFKPIIAYSSTFYPL